MGYGRGINQSEGLYKMETNACSQDLQHKYADFRALEDLHQLQILKIVTIDNR